MQRRHLPLILLASAISVLLAGCSVGSNGHRVVGGAIERPPPVTKASAISVDRGSFLFGVVLPGPSELPRGWLITDATYNRASGRLSILMTDPVHRAALRISLVSRTQGEATERSLRWFRNAYREQGYTVLSADFAPRAWSISRDPREGAVEAVQLMRGDYVAELAVSGSLATIEFGGANLIALAKSTAHRIDIASSLAPESPAHASRAYIVQTIGEMIPAWELLGQALEGRGGPDEMLAAYVAVWSACERARESNLRGLWTTVSGPCLDALPALGIAGKFVVYGEFTEDLGVRLDALARGQWLLGEQRQVLTEIERRAARGRPHSGSRFQPSGARR